MSSRNNCPGCGTNPPKMWNDGERWNCLCGWRGDEDEWLVADAMARAKVLPIAEDERAYEEVAASDHYEEAVKKVGDVGAMDVLLGKLKTGEWRVLAAENLAGGRCGCCSGSTLFHDVIEVRRVRITVDED